jgi:integrase
MWYATIQGDQVPLNVTDPNDEGAAWESLRKQVDAPASGHDRTVARTVDEYLADAGQRLKPKTVQEYRFYLNQFAARFGSIQIVDVVAKQIEADSRRSTWGPTTRANYLGTVGTMLRWASVSMKLSKPPRQSAGAETIIDEKTYRRMVELGRGDWPAWFTFSWETAARPSELRSMTVADVDLKNRVVRLKEHKTARRGVVRTIYLNDAAFDVAQRQIRVYGSGLLFRSRIDGPMTVTATTKAFIRLSAKLGVRVRPYGFRHSWATRALASGESDTIVAQLMGNSTRMLHRHYSHLGQRSRELRAAAERIGKAG